MTNPKELGELSTELRELISQMETSLDVDNASLIDQFLAKLDNPNELSDGDKSEIVSKLEAKAAEFSGEHPTLSGVIREIIDQLGKIGL